MELDGYGASFHIWVERWNPRQTGAVYKLVDKTHDADAKFDVSESGLTSFGRVNTRNHSCPKRAVKLTFGTRELD